MVTQSEDCQQFPVLHGILQQYNVALIGLTYPIIYAPRCSKAGGEVKCKKLGKMTNEALYVIDKGVRASR